MCISVNDREDQKARPYSEPKTQDNKATPLDREDSRGDKVIVVQGRGRLGGAVYEVAQSRLHFHARNFPILL